MPNEKTLILVLLDGPYISQGADIGYGIAKSALQMGYDVKIFLYMDGVHIPKKNQDPKTSPNVSKNFEKLIEKGAEVNACVRCAAARGYNDESHYLSGVKITSVYDLAEWMKKAIRL